MTHIVAHERVEFGDDVLVASKCFISDTNHGENESPEIAPNKRKLVTHPVKIGKKVWIGENVVHKQDFPGSRAEPRRFCRTICGIFGNLCPQLLVFHPHF